jgi:hypothetical protein
MIPLLPFPPRPAVIKVAGRYAIHLPVDKAKQYTPDGLLTAESFGAKT